MTLTYPCDRCGSTVTTEYHGGDRPHFCPACRAERNRERSRKVNGSISAQRRAIADALQFEDRTPLIMPQDRLKLALKAKAIVLGVSYEWAATVWIHGSAGRQFRRDGAYL
jgi:hypothetical protein